MKIISSILNRIIGKNGNIIPGQDITLNYPTNFTVIDFETTGFSYTNDEIVEIGAIKVRNLKIIDEFSELCNPFMEIKNSEVHGITNEDVRGCKHAKENIADLLKFIGDDTILIYNAVFDATFLNSYLNKNLENKIIDVLRLSRQYNDRDNHKLENIKKDLGIKEISHRAVEDCKTTLQYYIYLIKQKNMKRVEYFKFNSDLDTIRVQKQSRYADYILQSYKPDLSAIDIYNNLYNKVVCFTGVLKSMSREDAYKKVIDMGGQVHPRVTMKVDMLVVGDYDSITQKEKKAIEYNEQKGLNILILNEMQFRKMVNQ